MINEKPKNIEEYKEWLKRIHNITITKREITYYESICRDMKEFFIGDTFWKQLNDKLKTYEWDYSQKNSGYKLLYDTEVILVSKPFKSFFSKTFRRNIIENNNWPNEPYGGWVLPIDCLENINDILRTLIAVKYLDGVKFISERIKELCREFDKKCEVIYQAKEEGYYAVHLYTDQEFEIPKIDWDSKKISIKIEFQITTQLQEIIRKLLHVYYEQKREALTFKETKWQWDYGTDEFAANYLGHILHYVEGMIMEIREKQKGR